MINEHKVVRVEVLASKAGMEELPEYQFDLSTAKRGQQMALGIESSLAVQPGNDPKLQL